ncbi:hypothetical protein Pan216_31400 [Planctomycetes bacterium Pan216]|uniref:DUF4416 domain-containing protein n=1 Tax=Kolteria novifilia TaxID=2527975 RepID=A0A518B5L8_9BACT|nr:hypothetical protein Pan216_31400 [Planctomycetes bacterium Pan216]
MGSIRQQPPRAMLVAALFSRHEELLVRARTRLADQFGPIVLEGTAFSFQQTDYYARSMGTDLRKQLVAFGSPRPVDALPKIKVATNLLEREILQPGEFPEERPLNIDPGMADMAKLLLASTKDHVHRLYLGEGIFGEVTLHFRHGAWRAFPWTYPDYLLPEVHDFLNELREYLRRFPREYGASATVE